MVELSALAVVVTWTVLRVVMEKKEPKQTLLLRLLLLAVAAFIAEDSALRAYDYCRYDDDAFRFFFDRVPVVITLLWPMVIQSALDLAEQLDIRPSRVPLFCFVVVVVDAFVVEPIGVVADLWDFEDRGAFGVPVVCFLGWGCFAAAVALARRIHPLAVVVVAPLVFHALVLALWWGALRWTPPIGQNESLRALSAWVSSLAVVGLIVVEKPRGLRPLVLRRLPATLWIFALLGLNAQLDYDEKLIVWSLAFVPPWLALAMFSRAPAPPPAPDA